MFKTYLKIAIRNFLKDRFFSVINISGLAVGISVVLLIGLFIVHELSFDRFHSKADRIYRIATHLEMGGNIADINSTFPPLAKAIETDIPEVQNAIRLFSLDGLVFKTDEKVFSEDNVLYADPEFLDVFDFELLSGEKTTALSKRNQVLLTPALAKKYFNTTRWEDLPGKSVTIGAELFDVMGVIEDAPPNSHFHFNAVVSMESSVQGRDESWNSMNLSTYLLLKEHTEIKSVEEKIKDVFLKNMPNFDKLGKEGIVIESKALGITDIHLKSNIQGEFEPNGSMTTLYIFGSVALIVLLLACVNFVNLVTARSANRAKEVGVRKVLGSASSQLIRQFTLESVSLVFVATLIALGFVELLRAPFNALSGKQLPFDLLLSPSSIGVLIVFILFLGILAGSYPAFFLSSFKPAQVLKGKVRAGFRSSSLRNFLVTLQFVISIVLITCTFIVQDQLSFMRSKKLGFDKENVLILDNANRLASQESFINDLKQLPSVQNVAGAQFKPIDDYDGIPVTTELDKDNRKLVNLSTIDYDFLPTLKYDIKAGRNFSKEMSSDSTGVILNEKAAAYLFGNETPLDKKIFYDRKESYTVIGVVKDFNFESLKNEVRPLLFFAGGDQRYLHVRLNPGDHQASIKSIEQLWLKQSPDVPFTYSFLDESYTALFKQEMKLGLLFSVFTALALFIACLGLLGLAAYMADQRRKEISVRKVLGATLTEVFVLMSKDFLKIIAVAYIISLPIAYFAMREWLSDFAYRVNVSPLWLVAGGMLVIIVALATVSYQAIRSGLLNPVDALKEE
jgi:putative ABC transport system permease protein